MEKPDIRSMTKEDLTVFLSDLGEPLFRANQIFQWVQQKGVEDFSQMSNLSKALRDNLKENARISYVKKVENLVSKEDNTTKYLFSLEDGTVIESVLMKYHYGNTACISTQAGCRMGCLFCASTLGGVERNLTAGEMLAQIVGIQKDSGQRVSHVVLMGSGEPLDNYENSLQFIRLISDSDGICIGQRHITLSTCGLTEKIIALKQENLQITLAISLHAPNDEIRNSIMPISKKYPIEVLLETCRQYAQDTKRRITFEYALIKDVNDSMDCAKELTQRLRGMLCHVNLIPVNAVKERGYLASDTKTVEAFAAYLTSKGIDTTVRRQLGNDINASCGQLRKSYMK